MVLGFFTLLFCPLLKDSSGCFVEAACRSSALGGSNTAVSQCASLILVLCHRENVLKNLDDKAFDKPICEALLNQKYFNGIGNYLRAEILYR